MAWQDDLRRLDEERALGRVPEEAYRARREEILAGSAGAGAAGGQWHPEQPVQERTQSIMPGTGRGSRPAPAAPPPGQAGRPYQQGPPYGAPAQGPPQAPPLPGPPQQANLRPPPQWGEEAPPWGGDDAAMAPSWTTGGADAFEPGKKNNTAKIVTVVVVVLVVVGLCAGGYFLFFAGGTAEPNAAGGNGGTTNAQHTPKSTSRGRIAPLPGHVEDHSDITRFARAAKAHFLTDLEASMYRKAGAGKCRLASSTTKHHVHVLVFTARAASVGKAAAARDSLARQQVTYGLTAEENVPAGVRVARIGEAKDSTALLRAHYSHGDTIARIQVNGDDPATVKSVFATFLPKQLKALPADD